MNTITLFRSWVFCWGWKLRHVIFVLDLNLAPLTDPFPLCHNFTSSLTFSLSFWLLLFFFLLFSPLHTTFPLRDLSSDLLNANFLSIQHKRVAKSCAMAWWLEILLIFRFFRSRSTHRSIFRLHKHFLLPSSPLLSLFLLKICARSKSARRKWNKKNDKKFGEWFGLWLLVPVSRQNSNDCTKILEKSSDFFRTRSRYRTCDSKARKATPHSNRQLSPMDVSWSTDRSDYE